MSVYQILFDYHILITIFFGVFYRRGLFAQGLHPVSLKIHDNQLVEKLRIFMVSPYLLVLPSYLVQ